MNVNDKLEKTSAESEYWFEKFQVAHNHLVEKQDEAVKLHQSCDNLKRQLNDNQERFSFITLLQHAQYATGYKTAWHMGGVTAECLAEEINKAKNHKPAVKENKGSFDFNRPMAVRRANKDVIAYIDFLESFIKGEN